MAPLTTDDHRLTSDPNFQVSLGVRLNIFCKKSSVQM